MFSLVCTSDCENCLLVCFVEFIISNNSAYVNKKMQKFLISIIYN